MLPGATDAGLFMKPSMMLSIGKTTQHPQVAAKPINFLLNSKEGDAARPERGVPLSKSGYETLTASGASLMDAPIHRWQALSFQCCRHWRRSACRRIWKIPSWCRSLDSALQSIDYAAC